MKKLIKYVLLLSLCFLITACGPSSDDVAKKVLASMQEKFDTDAIIPIVNKLGQFLSDPLLRNIFGQKQNKIDINILKKLLRGLISAKRSTIL